MLEKIFIVAFIVFAIYQTMKPGMIFEVVSIKLASLNIFYQKPIFKCVICMSFWHGMYVYWLIFACSWRECFIVIIAAMGVNAVFTRLFPYSD